MGPLHKHAKPLLGLSAPAQNRLLEQYYDPLQKWALMLTRGDVGKSQDIVHELCLHLSLSTPDLSKIRNLDGYLYTCLRHIYLSDIARSSREVLQPLGPDNFDSIQMALWAQPSGDLLQQQNDLRKICAYVTWRKAQAKSASYFILRFFHGYYRSEIATIAGVSLATIDPKLNKARSEASLYVSEPGKLKFTSREQPPAPRLQWTPISSIAIFKELREAILTAREGDCPPEEDLLAHYDGPQPAAISCSLLSHIVSCERCLARIDQHFRRPTLKDREPLDGLGPAAEDPHPEILEIRSTHREAMFRSVRRHGSEIFDHRPRRLSIAVDGKIVASRDVQSESSMLSVRIERPENTSFIEVFSEQRIRLALLPLFELPPEGPPQRTQHVALSDDRWLELTLTFDGLGLNSEIAYFDPALAPQTAKDDTSEPCILANAGRQQTHNLLDWSRRSSLLTGIDRALRPFMPSPVMTWAIVIACVFSIAGYFIYRSEQPVKGPLNARRILDRSIQIETTRLKGQTEHQVLRFEEVSLDGSILNQGSIDRWSDGDGKRLMHRLYDTNHRLIAAEWIESNGKRGRYQKDDVRSFAADRELLVDNLWDQDVSPASFREMNGDNAQVRALGDGYALTTEPGVVHPNLLSATLVVDRHLHPIREVLHVRNGEQILEVRFVEADYERRPSTSVPDIIFDPRDQGLRASTKDRQQVIPENVTHDVRLTELYIAVLYQLNNLNADTSDPIEVKKTSDGHIRIAGMVSSEDRKQAILTHLRLLDNHQLLEVRLLSPRDIKHVKSQRIQAGTVSMYDVEQTKAPADDLLRAYFQTQGLSGNALDDAVGGFSNAALSHAQHALQNASALKCLSDSFAPSELKFVSHASQQQWIEMAAKHAAALEAELRSLNEQLASLSPSSQQIQVPTDTDLRIESPAQFSRATNDLFVKTKDLDQGISNIFASTQPQSMRTTDIRSLIAALRNAIPIQTSVEITSFAAQLNASGRAAAATNRHHDRLETQTSNRL